MTARDQGFTIFEALVAFAILASVVSALYAVSATSLRLIGKSGRVEQAAMLAQSKLDELAVIRYALPPAQAGTFANSDIDWRVEARDLPSGKAGPQTLRLQAVKLILSWPGAKPLVVETRHLGVIRRE
jgi:type II secretory pathway pseudopilin PulG